MVKATVFFTFEELLGALIHMESTTLSEHFSLLAAVYLILLCGGFI